MKLARELHYRNDIASLQHEVALSVVFTGMSLSKAAYALLRPYGLTDAQFNILMTMKYQSGPSGLTQTELGRMLLVNKSNITGMIDRMEEAGWVQRRDDPDDRRAKYLQLTAKGRRLLEKTEPIYIQSVMDLMNALSDRDLKSLTRMLEKIREGLNP